MEIVLLDTNIVSFIFKKDSRAKSYRKMGQPISPQDAWIAATACQYDIPLITHNPVDFESVKDLEIITDVK